MKSKDFETIRECLLTYERSLTTLNREVEDKLKIARADHIVSDDSLEEVSYEQVVNLKVNITGSIHSLNKALEELK